MAITIQAGNFYVIGFGRGTQLIFAHSITKTGKRAVITRCESWKTDPHWNDVSSTIKVDDARLREDLGTLCPIAKGPFSTEYLQAVTQATKDYRKEEKAVIRAHCEELNSQAELLNIPACEKLPNRGGDLKCEGGVHFVPGRWSPEVGSHGWNCVAERFLKDECGPIFRQSQDKRDQIEEIGSRVARILANA